jgi:hypothetical protein
MQSTTSRITLLLNQILHSVKLLEYLRILGSTLIVVSYFVVLHVDAKLGVVVHLVADAVTIPYFLKYKMWDMVIMLGFLTTIGISKLLS